jgi:hypothetical protein
VAEPTEQPDGTKPVEPATRHDPGKTLQPGWPVCISFRWALYDSFRLNAYDLLENLSILISSFICNISNCLI